MVETLHVAAFDVKAGLLPGLWQPDSPSPKSAEHILQGQNLAYISVVLSCMPVTQLAYATYMRWRMPV